MKNVLSIGGYDPTGGAGIIADAKTIKVLGCNPLTVITGIIPQNNLKVYDKIDLPKEELDSQLNAIFEDFEVSIVKTGVLNNDAIDLILKYQNEHGFKIICDPVLKSTTGYDFIDDKLISKYFELFEKSYIITPNKEEYDLIKNFDEYIKLKNNNNYILITGTDDKLLYNNKELRIFKGKKINKEVHGTGCVFSSAIASFIAKRYDIVHAINEAKNIVLSSVIYANKTKYGYNSNPLYINKRKVIDNINYAVYLLKKMNFSLIPEVGSNIAESLILPKSYYDVAALTGRIIKNKLGGFYIVGDVEFGASEHIAKIILAVSQFNPKIRACMNIKYDGELIKKLKDDEEKHGFKVASFDRKDEPSNVSSMEWGTKTAFANYILNNNLDPAKEEVKIDIVYDKGGDGKEPMIRILGYDAVDVIKKVRKIEKIFGEIGD